MNETNMKNHDTQEDDVTRREELEAYALNIISHTPDFKSFAIAMMDYIGEADPIVIGIYDSLFSMELPEGVKLEKNYRARLGQDCLEAWYSSFKAEEERKANERRRRMQEDVDELMNKVSECRDSEIFKKRMEFIGKFHYLGSYNAMLVSLQKPGARLVLAPGMWKRYGRRPRLNGQALITLQPFGPVQIMYDISDTERIEGMIHYKDEEILEYYTKSLNRAEGHIERDKLDTLFGNLPSYGIWLDTKFKAASTYGGYLMRYDKADIQPRINKETSIKAKSRFVISVNIDQSETSQFLTVCHELGHLFCRHLFYDPKKERNLTVREEEFEAETVAWLVCKRNGVSNPSEEYLAGYARNGEIPECNVDQMMKAVAEIEKMMKGTVHAKDGLWYKNDSAFRKDVDEHSPKARKQGEIAT